MGDQASFSSWDNDIGFSINFQEESGIVTFWSIELPMPLKVSRDIRMVSRCGGHIGLSLGSPNGFRTSLHLVWYMTSLHSSHCREIRASFESGHLAIHSIWVSKRLSHSYCWEVYCWGACGKLACLFNRILGIRSILEMIWSPWSLPRVPVLKLVFL